MSPEAVFPDEVIAAHQHVIEHNRTLRPLEKCARPKGEWQEFEDHFLLRKVALGDCHRRYGSPGPSVTMCVQGVNGILCIPRTTWTAPSGHQPQPGQGFVRNAYPAR